MTKKWGLKDLLGLERLSPAQIEATLDQAASFKKSAPKGLLAGRAVAFLFTEASTRTRSSFEMAAKRLGAEVLSFSAAGSSLAKGETLLDTMLNLQAVGVTHFVVRHERSGALEALAPAVKASVINAGDGWHEHPTQALLDLMTLRERWGSFKGRRLVILGDIRHSRVARSNLFALKKLGAKVTFCGPTALVPDAFKELGATVEHDLEKALKDADAVNVLRLQLERMEQGFVSSLSDYALAYQLTTERADLMKPEALILHPGPVNRGVEISSEAADGPRSLILDQVANGVFARMAVLALCDAGRTHV
ncbi:MAG TPA: aspartate carbamoyltransferase [Elusimicrobia bacterium]|nr:MAG: aspartate carbamoyltransferase [Elusimicrobia bacterium GWA2_66_18]OGR72000.1 MAG: aspartate carbamoyltransferase [Elusimicrobia bacterium GWC2_65_9]HAZ08827.1 aspartate carbamoyltransferase [Elusimicrobiota bacterium]